MRSLVYFDVPNRRVCSTTSGDAFTLPKLPAGQSLTLALRGLDILNGARVETELFIRSIRATLGAVDVRPTSGQFKFQIGVGASTPANTTVALDWNAQPQIVANAFNVEALSAARDGQTISVEWDAGSWLISRADGAALTLSIVGNTLRPMANVRIRGAQDNAGRWIYDARPTVLPYALTSSFALVDPEAPSISLVRAGGESGGGSYQWSTVQAINLPSDFIGVYQLRDPRTSAKTALLDRSDSPTDVAAAVQAILAAGETVTGSLPTANVGHLTFGGTLLGVDVPLFEVQVFSAPSGDPTFTLFLDRPPLWAALRAQGTLNAVPLEIRLELCDSAEDVANPDAPSKLVISQGLAATILAPVAYEGLEEAAETTLIRPPNSPSYLPVDPSNIGVGQLWKEFVRGDGATVEFVLDHDLGSQALTGSVVVDRTTGALLKTGFTAYEVSANSLRIVFDAAPTTAEESSGGVSIRIATPQTLSVFLEGFQIAIANVLGLQDQLDGFGTSIAALQAVLPTTGPGAASASGTALSVKKRDVFTLFPFAQRSAVHALVAKLVADNSGDVPSLPLVDTAALPRAGYLPPAIHDATVENWDGGDPLPAASTVPGHVYAVTAADLQLVGVGGLPSSLVREGGFVGCDGRAFYEVRNVADTQSYYPVPAEKEFFRYDINDQQFRIGATLELEFYLALQLLAANCTAEVFLEVEVGYFQRSSDSDSGPPLHGPDVIDIVWADAPILSQQIDISGDQVTHRFGVRMKRAVGGITADTLKYSTWIGGAPPPDTATFVIRAMLRKFDVDNTLDPRGYLFAGFMTAGKPLLTISV